MNAIATRKFVVLVLLFVIALLLILLSRPRYGLRVADLRPAWRPPVSAPATPITHPPTLRVATYNLEHFTDARRDGPDRTPAVLNLHATGAASSLVEANPDIAVFQEVENAAALRALNSRLPTPYPFAYVTAFRHGSGRPDTLNHALLSRIPPSIVRQISFTRLLPSLYATRGALAATFPLSPTLDLLVYDLHLKSNFGDAPAVHAQRQIALHVLAADAASQTAQALLGGKTLLVLLLGDTNTDPDSPAFADDPSLSPLAGSYLDLWRGVPLPDRTTIPTRLAGPEGDPALVFPPSAFDRVFASRNFLSPESPYRPSQPVAVQRGCATHDNSLQPGFGGHVTDHYLVYVDLLPPTSAPSPAAAADSAPSP